MGNLIRTSFYWVLILQLAAPFPLAHAEDDIATVKSRMDSIGEKPEPALVADAAAEAPVNSDSSHPAAPPVESEAHKKPTSILGKTWGRVSSSDNRAWNLGAGIATAAAVWAFKAQQARYEAKLEATGHGRRERFEALSKRYPEIKAVLKAKEAALIEAEAELSKVIKQAPQEFKKPMLKSASYSVCDTYFGRLGGRWRESVVNPVKSATAKAKGMFARTSGEKAAPAKVSTAPEVSEDPGSPKPESAEHQVKTIQQYEAAMRGIEEKYADYEATVKELEEEIRNLTLKKLTVPKAEDLRQKNPFGKEAIFDHARARALMRSFESALDDVEMSLAYEVKTPDIVREMDGTRHARVRPRLLSPATWMDSSQWKDLIRDSYLVWRQRSWSTYFKAHRDRVMFFAPLIAVLISTTTQEKIRASEEAAVDAEEDRNAVDKEKLTKKLRNQGNNNIFYQHVISVLTSLWAEYQQSVEQPRFAGVSFPLEKDFASESLIKALWEQSVDETEVTKNSVYTKLWIKILARLKAREARLEDRSYTAEAWKDAELAIERDVELQAIAAQLGAKTPEAILDPKADKGLVFEARQIRAQLAMLLWANAQGKMGDKFPFPGMESPLLFGEALSDKVIDLIWRRALKIAESKEPKALDVEGEFWVQVLLLAERKAGQIDQVTNLEELKAAEGKAREKYKDLIQEWSEEIKTRKILKNALPGMLEAVKESAAKESKAVPEKAKEGEVVAPAGGAVAPMTPMTEVKPSDAAKPSAMPPTSSESKPGSKPEPKTEPKTEPKAQPDAKPDLKKESKPESKPESESKSDVDPKAAKGMDSEQAADSDAKAMESKEKKPGEKSARLAAKKRKRKAASEPAISSDPLDVKPVPSAEPVVPGAKLPPPPPLPDLIDEPMMEVSSEPAVPELPESSDPAPEPAP